MEWNREWHEKKREMNKMVIYVLKSSIKVHLDFGYRFPVIVILIHTWEDLMCIPKYKTYQ